MKYVLSYAFTTAMALLTYYIAFFVAAMASLLTNGTSTYVLLILAACISGLLGPICLYVDKNTK